MMCAPRNDVAQAPMRGTKDGGNDCEPRDMSCGRDMPSARYAAGDPLPPMRGARNSLSFAERTYRMRVYEHISNASLRAYIESSGARYIESRAVRPSTDSLRLRRSIYCARRGIAQFDMCFALDMPAARYAARARRDGTGETNELTASRRELRAKNTLVTLPPLRGRWRVATEGAIDWQFSLCVPLPREPPTLASSRRGPPTTASGPYTCPFHRKRSPSPDGGGKERMN